MTTAIIVAAGSSSRMKTNISKQLIELDGIPVILRTINVFEFLSEIDSVLIVTRKCDIEIIKKLVSEHNIKKVSAVIEGGSTRQESVFLGLSHLNSGNDDIVLIHDGARPFVSASHIKEIISELRSGSSKAAAIGVPVKDTIKQTNERGYIKNTPDRSKLVSIQTPQGFRYGIIMEAHKKARELNLSVTDDCAVIEALTSEPVKVITGDYNNIKITTPEDIILGEAIIAKIQNNT